MSLPKTRAEAIKAGSRWYFTGKPCLRGHISPRFTRGCHCTECNKEHSRKIGPAKYKANAAYRKSQIDASRSRQVRLKYGLTLPEYEGLILDAGTACQICTKPMVPFGKFLLERSVLDHCHDSGEIRDVICGGCNLGLGNFRDDPTALRNAALYIEKHNGNLRTNRPLHAVPR